MTMLAGVRYDGRAPVGEPVTLAVEGDSVAVVREGTTDRFPRAMIALDAPIPGIAERLRTPDGAMIELDATAATRDMFAPRARLARLACLLETHWLPALAAAAISAVALWFVVTDLLPLAADPVARQIQPEMQEMLGHRTLASLDRLIAKPSRLPKEERARIAEVLWGFMEHEPDVAGYELQFRRMGAPNAFALPGNIIVVTDELVKFVHSDDELLAVLAHEIGHLRARHALRLVLQQSGIAVLATVVAGDAVGVTILAAAVPAMLLDARYSRAFEAEADELAFAHLARHGVSPRAFAAVMRRFADDARRREPNDPLMRYLSSHPPTEERIRRALEAAGSSK